MSVSEIDCGSCALPTALEEAGPLWVVVILELILDTGVDDEDCALKSADEVVLLRVPLDIAIALSIISLETFLSYRPMIMFVHLLNSFSSLHTRSRVSISPEVCPLEIDQPSMPLV